MIYEANPECNLSIEDHWGRSTQPMLAPAFLGTLGEWDADRLDNVFRHLHQGQALLQACVHPTEAAAKQMDWTRSFPERQRANAGYAKNLRDQIVLGRGAG